MSDEAELKKWLKTCGPAVMAAHFLFQQKAGLTRRESRHLIKACLDMEDERAKKGAKP